MTGSRGASRAPDAEVKVRTGLQMNPGGQGTTKRRAEGRHFGRLLVPDARHGRRRDAAGLVGFRQEPAGGSVGHRMGSVDDG